MAKRIEVDDGAWFEISSQLDDVVVEHAMNENLRFGDALIDVLSEHYGDGE